MLRSANLLIILFLVSNLLVAQNGNSLNRTFQIFVNNADGMFRSHPEIVTFYDEKPDSTAFHFYPSIDIQPVLSNNKLLVSGRMGAGFHSAMSKKMDLDLLGTYQFSTYPEFITRQIDSLLYIPGNGFRYLKSRNYYHWLNVYGSLKFKPYEYLQLEIGNDKHFLGNGYRSLFLSDNSGAFPYVALNVNVWNIHYVSLTNLLHDVYTEVSNEISYKPKFSTLHFISWNITPHINLNLFEAVVWRNADSALYNGLNINYLNPVIFMRPVEYAQGSTDNSLLGLGLNIKLHRSVLFYSQFILDEYFGKEIKNKGYRDNKYGYQLGIKGKTKIMGPLNWQLEYNHVRPFTYSHYHTLQTYGNRHQALAHPLGANFKEYIFSISGSRNKYVGSFHLAYAQYGKDGFGELHGNDLYANYWSVDRFGHFMMNGIKTNRLTLNVLVGYLLKPEWNLAIESGMYYQLEKSELEPENFNVVFIRLKTWLYNDQWFEK